MAVVVRCGEEGPGVAADQGDLLALVSDEDDQRSLSLCSSPEEALARHLVAGRPVPDSLGYAEESCRDSSDVLLRRHAWQVSDSGLAAAVMLMSRPKTTGNRHT